MVVHGARMRLIFLFDAFIFFYSNIYFRLCEFPVTLVLRNECGRARMADVELRMKPKVG